VFTLFARPAKAAPPVPSGDETVSEHEPRALEVPRLLEFAKAIYPPEAELQGIEADVILVLTIDAEGAVTDVNVPEPAGHGFDEAARIAAFQFRFAPARRNGVALASRIRYRYEFRLPAPEAVAQAAATVQAPPEPSASGSLTPPRGPREIPRAPDVELVVQGQSAVERMRQSAEAVRVVELERARHEASDLGEVLARTEGVSMRTQGGLGSYGRLALNGLGDDQIAISVDGIPLAYTGYQLGGVANMPVNILERVDRYSGVVPIRFGTDALGGALNLITRQPLTGTGAAASYQVGSWSTHRATLGAHHVDTKTRFVTRLTAFSDYAENDYPIQVEVPDSLGRPRPATVYRSHDTYRAQGAGADLGFIKRPFADRLLLRLFITDYGKELQHNAVMTVPYGEANYGARALGGSLNYEQRLSQTTRLELLTAYANTSTSFEDTSTWVYDWFGRRIRQRRVPGEISNDPADQTVRQHSLYTRAYFKWLPNPQHAFRVSVAPSYETRSGEDRTVTQGARDPLSAQRNMLRIVSGVEYEADLFDDRLENVFFIKDYVYRVQSEEPLASGVFRARDAERHRLGFGNALRYRLRSFAYTKLSYEYATRLPRPEQVFGDAVLIVDNLGLLPEVSHNGNLGITLDLKHHELGRFKTTATGFLRRPDDLIVLLGNERVFSYQNVYAARSVGIESNAEWASPGEHLALDGNLTLQDFRNASAAGTFGDFNGDRIPNRPYFFANAGARFQLREVSAPGDQLALSWHARYVGEFFRGWESFGVTSFKQKVPSQFIQSVTLVYVLRAQPFTISSAFEVDNVLDAKAYDFFGVQRPGRSFYFKGTFALER
jgi:TonB family protein